MPRVHLLMPLGDFIPYIADILAGCGGTAARLVGAARYERDLLAPRLKRRAVPAETVPAISRKPPTDAPPTKRAHDDSFERICRCNYSARPS